MSASAKSGHVHRSKVHLFDHLVGRDEQLVGHVEAEHPGGLDVDDQLELDRLLDWQFRRLRALEDATGIDAQRTKRICKVTSVAHQPAGFGKIAPWVYCGNCVARRQVGKLHPSAVEEGVAANEEGVGPLAHKCCEGRVDLAAGSGVENLDCYQLTIEKIDPCQIAARPGETGDKTEPDDRFIDAINNGQECPVFCSRPLSLSTRRMSDSRRGNTNSPPDYATAI